MNHSEHAHEVAVIPLTSIRVVKLFNPRTAFRTEPLERLVDSIRANGLIQPLAVRPSDEGEGYDLIAGERRYRACNALSWVEVPVHIIHCDSEQSRKLALLENIDREDLSVAEQALAAREALDLAGGDRAATALQLGWSGTKLDSRLMLLTASQSVLAAVAEGTILIGHAQQLAGLPESQQDKALGLIIENKVSVAELREQLKRIVIPLTSAIFNTAGCEGCPSNSSSQRTLWGDAIDGSNCKNKPCFTNKTTLRLEEIRATLQEDVGTVALTTEKDESSYIPLIVNGVGGVGTEQFAQCRGCVHFGALIHAKLDAKCGQVDRPICFSTSCNSTKVGAHAEVLAAANAPAPTPASPSGKDAAKPKGASATAVPTKNSSKAITKTAKTVAPAASSSSARAAMKPAYTAAASVLLAEDTRIPLALAILAMSKVLREAGVSLPAKVIPDAKTPEEVIAVLAGLDGAEVVSRFRLCTEAMIAGDQANSSYSRNDVFPAVIAAKLAQSAKADLAPHFKVSSDYLAALTREGNASLLEESGFKAWMEAQDGGAKKYKALIATKKADLPKSILDAGYDWSGFVPKSVASVKARDFVGI